MQDQDRSNVVPLTMLHRKIDRRTRSRGGVMANSTGTAAAPESRTFADDVNFLRAHTDIVVLSSAKGSAQVAVAPANAVQGGDRAGEFAGGCQRPAPGGLAGLGGGEQVAGRRAR